MDESRSSSDKNTENGLPMFNDLGIILNGLKVSRVFQRHPKDHMETSDKVRDGFVSRKSSKKHRLGNIDLPALPK